MHAHGRSAAAALRHTATPGRPPRGPRPGRGAAGAGARQDGVALVVALLVFALCAALLVALQRDFTLAYQRASNRFLAEQSWSYLRGAEELATLALQIDEVRDREREAPRDDLTEVWAREATPYALEEGGWLVGSLQDLQGRFNLNSLVSQTPGGEAGGAARYTPAQRVFIRLLQTFEELPLSEYEAIAVTESIGDWLDADGNPRFNGAEATVYASRSPPYRPANAPMRDVSELRAVANVSPELYLRLLPLVTVWPESPRAINIHTAPQPLLRALHVLGGLQPLSPADGEALLQQRAESGFAGVDDYFAQPVFAGASPEALTALRALLGESSSYFLLTARVEIADREQRLYSVLRREERRVDVLQRLRGAL